MNIDYKQAKAVFLEAIHNVPSDGWDSYVDRVCADDADLRSYIHGLLEEHASAGQLATHAVQSVAAKVAPPSAEGPGSLIGSYKLLEQIGEGGMGLVYMAEQQRPVRRLVALKLVKPGMDSKQVIARFEAERQALAMMDHQNIAKVLDAGTTEAGRPYFVMELVRGIPINQLCDEKRLAVRERLELFIQVCQAVQHAHQKGIIHRDLKLTNVLVTMHDSVPVPKIIDFGIAKALGAQLTEHTLHTGFAQLVGTPLYMSPEQAEMNQFGVDTRSDIYSLGVMLYELLTGTTPFDKETLTKAGFDEMRRIIRENEPPRPSARLSTLEANALSTVSNRRSTDPRHIATALRGELDWIVMKALQKERSDRYESASSLAADIERYLSDEPVQACPPSVAYRLRKFARKHKAAFSTAALVAAALALGTVISTWQAVRATSAEMLATERFTAAEDEAAQKRIALNDATTANENLRQKQRELRQNLYRADTDLAYQAWHAGLPDRTVELLERHRPQAGQDDIRGFEWSHLWQRSHDYLWNLPIDDLKPRTTFSHEGTQVAVTHNNEQGGDGRLHGGVYYERWRDGKKIDEFGKPIENYQPPTPRKRPPRQGDTIVRIFDARGGTLQKTLTYPGCSFGDVVFSHDDSAVVFWSFEGLIAMNAATGDLTARLARPFDDDNVANSPPPLAASPTNPWVVVALDDETIALLDVVSMQTVRTWPGKRIWRLAFSPNGKLVAGYGWDSQISLWESETGALKHTVRPAKASTGAFKGGQSRSFVAFSADSNVLAFNELGLKRIAFWDIAKGARTSLEVKVETNSPYGDYIQTIHFIPHSNLLAASSVDGLVRYWDAKSGNLVRQTPGLTQPTVSSGGKLLAGQWGSEIRVFEREPRTYRQVNAKREPIACSFRPGTDVLFTWQPSQRSPTVQNSFQSWRASTHEPIESFPALGPIFSSPNIQDRLAVSADGKLAAIVSDETLLVFSGNKFANQRTFDAKRLTFASVAISPDKRWVATGGSRRMELEHPGNITLWDAKTLRPVLHMDQPWRRMTKAKPRLFPDPSPGYPEVTFVAFSPDGKQLASTGNLKEICLWSVATGELQHELWNASASCLAYSPDGSLLASIHDSAPERFMIKFWNPHHGELIASLAGHTDRITRLAFSPDGKTLASAGYDGIRLWNVATRERVGYLDDARTAFTSLSFSGDSKTLVAGDTVGRLHFWRAAEQ